MREDEDMTIVEFLLARIAEDETTARDRQADAMLGHRWKSYSFEAYSELQTEALASTARVLAECAAKRAIVERHEPYDDIQVRRQTRTLAGDTLRHLAAVYADHPDYREEWKP